MFALGIIIFGLVIIINLLALLCSSKKMMHRDGYVLRHTAIGTVRLRKGQKTPARFTVL